MFHKVLNTHVLLSFRMVFLPSSNISVDGNYSSSIFSNSNALKTYSFQFLLMMSLFTHDINRCTYNILIVSSAKHERLLCVQFRPCFNQKWFCQGCSSNIDNNCDVMVQWKLSSAKVQIILGVLRRFAVIKTSGNDPVGNQTYALSLLNYFTKSIHDHETSDARWRSKGTVTTGIRFIVQCAQCNAISG